MRPPTRGSFRARLPGLLLLAAGLTAGAAGPSAVALASPLQAAVARIAAETPWRSPGTALAVSVHHLATNERAGHRADALQVTASAAKPMWVAAALHRLGVARVEPFAEAALGYSDLSRAPRARHPAPGAGGRGAAALDDAQPP